MQKNKYLYISLSVAISIILMALLFSQIETKDLVEMLSRIHFPALLVYISVTLGAAGLRAWRYKLLLHPQSIGWGNILLVTFVRNSLIDLLPWRIGSFSYIYILNKRLNFSFEAATSTFVMAFIFDFLTLSPFLVLAIFALGLGSTSISTPSLVFLSIVFFFIIFLILWKIIPFFLLLIKIYRFLLKILGLEKKDWTGLSIEKFQATINSLSQIQKRKIYLPISLLSFVLRLSKYVAVYFLLFSLLRSHGFSLQSLSIWKLILGITGAELTSLLPVKGIAGFGTWESAWALTFKLMNFEAHLAILSGIGVHLLTNIFEYSLGIASLLILAFPLLKKMIK